MDIFKDNNLLPLPKIEPRTAKPVGQARAIPPPKVVRLEHNYFIACNCKSMFLMCSVLTAAEDSYFEHVCNYSMYDLVNVCHVSKQTLAPILNIQPSYLATVLQPGVTSCYVMLCTDHIIKGGGGINSSNAGCVKLAAYCKV
jgi:hypothetical protein